MIEGIAVCQHNMHNQQRGNGMRGTRRATHKTRLIQLWWWWWWWQVAVVGCGGGGGVVVRYSAIPLVLFIGNNTEFKNSHVRADVQW
jgi:hypothetical protein